ncbi:MAG: hypothetical protein LC118_15700 [Dehalococcoidia bacterium]|nr:hypothetical protein [Dehalococcoidia bacterium]
MGPLIPIALEIARVAAPGFVKWLTNSDTAADAATTVIEAAQQATGTGTPDAALARLQSDPTAVLELKRRSIELEAELEKAYLADRADARQAAVELAKAGDTSSTDRKTFMVRLDVVGLIFGLAGMMLLGGVRAEYPDSISEGVFGALLAQLSTITSYFGLCLRDAHQYEFGSSRGSEQKNAMLTAKK